MRIERVRSNWYDLGVMKPGMKYLAALGFVFSCAVAGGAAGISISPNTWNPGTLSGGSVRTNSFTVQNTGFEMLNVRVKGNHTASWTLGGAGAYNQFQLEFDAAGDSSYQGMTTSYQDESSGTNNMINKKYLTTFTLYLRLTSPTGSSTASTQTITVDIQGTTDDFWTYNASGGFYWRNVGDSAAPVSDWATSTSTIMTSSKWQYMNNPSAGWLTYGANTFSMTVTHSFVIDNIRTAGNGNAIAGTCYYSHASLRTYNFTSGPSDVMRTRKVSFAKYTFGTLINSALATNTYATRSVLMPSVVISSEYQALRRSYSLTFCSHCGYVPSRVTNDGGVYADMSARTIVSSHFSVGTPQARIIVLN